MKSLLFAAMALLVATASAKDGQPVCADETVKAAVQKNYKQYGASTNSCGIKPLNVGEFLETYLVCVSDETEPTEYIAVVEPRNGKCNVKFLAAATEASTPNFDTETIYVRDIADAISCRQDPSDGILVCAKPKKGPTQEEINNQDPCYKTLAAQLEKDAAQSGDWGFESLSVISKDGAWDAVNDSELAQSETSELEYANFKKLVRSDDTLTYFLTWTAPSNSGTSILVADKLTCKEKASIVTYSEE